MIGCVGAQKGPFGENSYGAALGKVLLAKIRMVLHAERSIWREFVWCCMQNGPFGENSYGAELRKVRFAKIHMMLSSERSVLQKFI